MPSLPKIRRKIFFPFLSTLILFLSIFAGVVLVQRQQELREKAQSNILRVPQDYSTMEAAYNAASHGDTILVAPGSYTVCLSGNRTKRIILRAENPATTSPANKQSILNSGCSHVIQFQTPLDNDGIFNPGEVVEFNGFVLKGSDDGFSFEGASGIVKDNIITGQSDDPIDIDKGSEAHIIGNILQNGTSGGDGIENRLHGFSSSREIRLIFRNNIIYRSKKDGIQLIDQTGSKTKRKYLIANNLIIGNGQAGIGTTKGGDSNQGNFPGGYPLPEKMYVVHNTFVNNGWDGILGGANMKVHNNIFYKNGRAGLKNVSGNSIATHNLFFGNSPDHSGSNVSSPNVFADPKFINTGLPPNFASFQLESSSPAIDAGKVINSFYSEFGVTPPGYTGGAPDLGWIESGATGPIPTPTILPTATPTPKPTSTPSPAPTAAPGCQLSSTSWQNFSIAPQTGTFSVEFDATPVSAGSDALTMLSAGSGAAYTDYAILTRFNGPGGIIDARNGSSYQAQTQITYTPGTTYRFRLEIDVPANSYSVYVTPQGGSEQTIGTNFAFRTEQSGIAVLDNWGLRAGTGSHQVCNLTFSASTTPLPTLPGDLDKDGDVDIFDYNLLVGNFGATNCGNVADIDGDCDVDIFDYNTLVSNFGKKG